MKVTTIAQLVAVAGAAVTLVSADRAQAAPTQAHVQVQVSCVRIGYACASLTVKAYALPSGFAAGSGRVTSEPAGIDCSFTNGALSGTCSLAFYWPAPTSPPPITTVVLRWTAAPGSQACHFGPGVCGGETHETYHQLGNGLETSSSYNFALLKRTLTVTKTGDATGVVSSEPAGITCGSSCSGSFDHGATVSLSAVPDAGAEFRGWTGACAAQPATCTVTVDAAKSTNAVFGLRGSRPPQPQPQPQPQPSPQPQPQPTPDLKRVDVDILGHRLGRSALGFRLIRIELEVDERVAATLVLTRGAKRLLTMTVPALAAGRRVVTLVLPRRIVKGRAYLTLRLRDDDGNTRSWGRSVLIQRRSR
jgi:hypothetical protein